MKLETFFEYFDQFADAPDAVAGLRALVLELAVRGRLSERRASDCTDSEWLNLLKVLDAKDSNSQLGPRSIFDIPSSWRWATLNDLGDTKPRNEASDSATCSFVPMTFISAEYGQAVQYEERIWGEVKKGYTHFSDGDVVMAKITPCFENGKSAIVDNLAGRIGAGTTELHVFRRNSSVIDPWFVLLYLKSNGFIERGVPRMTGSAGQKRVPSDYFANSPFPLPPPAEQKRIVAKVDELMALCDRLEARQKERENRHVALTRATIARFDETPTPANLNFLFHTSYAVTPADLRKTILNLAVRGKLVTQEPRDEPAETLFERIQGEKARYAETHGIRINESKKEGEKTFPFEIPAPWKWTSLSSLFNVVTDGDHLPPPKADSGVAFLTIGNITTGSLDFSSTRFVPDRYYRALAEFRRPVIGDILYTVVGATYGRPALVDTTKPFCIQRHIALLRPAPSMDIDFLLLLLKSPLVYGQATASTTGTAQPTVPLGALRSFRVPLPPLSEQKRIAAKASQLMTLADQLEMQLAASVKTAEELLGAVVHELLQPTVDVVEIPNGESDDASQRAALGCYAIEKLQRNPSFGHTMNMKAVYMAQAHIGLPLELKFERQAAGPWHPWIEQFDAMGQREGWFTVTQKSIGDGHTKYEYVPKAALKQKVAEAAAVLGEQKVEFDRLLGFFADMKTVDAEIVATLFAAWNDFLLDGKTPTDDEIIREVRENWHQSKERFIPALLQRWLDWMRRQRLTPNGHGPRTRQQLSLGLG